MSASRGLSDTARVQLDHSMFTLAVEQTIIELRLNGFADDQIQLLFALEYPGVMPAGLKALAEQIGCAWQQLEDGELERFDRHCDTAILMLREMMAIRMEKMAEGLNPRSDRQKSVQSLIGIVAAEAREEADRVKRQRDIDDARIAAESIKEAERITGAKS